jgi:hypothetical protein
VFQGQFAAVSAESTGLLVSVRHCGQNMDTPLHSRDQATVKTMGSQWGVSTQKGENRSFSREGYGDSLLGFTRNNLCSCSHKIDGVKVPTHSTSPFSPDLAPSDYYLFPNMKKWLAGRRCYSNKEVIAETNAYFAELCQSYYSEGINKLEQHWTKCISLKGDFVKK